jgi:hypothetical protein
LPIPPDASAARAVAAGGSGDGVSRKGQPMTVKESGLSPYDRFMAHRRRIFLRDWILVLIALGLAIAAGAFNSDRIRSHESPVTSSAAVAR